MQATDVINKLIAAACLTAGAFLLYLIYTVVAQVMQADHPGFGAVASVILVGFAAFLGIMNILSFGASWIGILDAKQAFGLPEGSVRAVLTIAFIVIVGVLASFLLTNSVERPMSASDGIPLNVEIATADEARAYQKSVAVTEGIVGILPSKTKSGTYDVNLYVRRDTKLKEDVSKQVLTILSTILAAMIGFYFGSRPGDSKPDTAK